MNSTGKSMITGIGEILRIVRNTANCSVRRENTFAVNCLIWERWNGFGGMNSMNSFNHYAFGSVVSWIYEYAAGIKALGSNNFIIQPDFNTFRQIKCGFETLCGYLEVEYTVNDDSIEVFCIVPANAQCQLVLPHTVKKLGSGCYSLKFIK